LSAIDATPTVAAIDIGTNSIHMVVVRIDPRLPAMTIVDRQKETVRLGEWDSQTGNLTAAAIDRAIAALKRCRAVAETFQVTDIVAVATSATREAPNGGEFLERVYNEVGLRVDLISGQEEARRIYLGVISGIEFNNHPHVTIDIGGGSTELILGDGGDPQVLSSTKIGAIRLTEKLGKSDILNDVDLAYLYAFSRGNLERAIEEIQANLAPGMVPKLIGTSGTIETIAAAIQRERQSNASSRIHGVEITRQQLVDFIQKMRNLSLVERSQVPGMNDRRAEIIVPGGVILHTVMNLLDIDRLVVCERSLREGSIVDWMLDRGYIDDRLRYQSTIKERNTLKIADKYGVDLDRGQRIATFATTLFDATIGILHQHDDRYRRYLWTAAVLHNSGHFISHSSHHKHSYYLIRHGELLGYNETEIETIANIARYHRKSPPKKKHDEYQKLPRENKKPVCQLSAMLRVAIALDRRQIGAISKIDVNFNPDDRILSLDLHRADPADDCLLEIWNLDYKKQIFEQEFNLRLQAQLV
jgi:exopolyphosphatase / guanosine-5'-triphosphate,3'-diphosphate pyrophosphatase